MLTYTFSKREKVLIAIMAVVLIGVLWWKFVFEGVNNRLTQLDSDIATAQNTLVVEQAKAANITRMKAQLEAWRASGIPMKTMPTYDNIKPLSIELNRILGGATTYTLKFDDVSTGADAKKDEEQSSASTDSVQRGVTLSFDCDSYATARAILSALVDGEYPCSIDSLSIVDNSVRNGARSTADAGKAFSTTAHLTFYEKLPPEIVAANKAAADAKAQAEAAAAEASSAA